MYCDKYIVTPFLPGPNRQNGPTLPPPIDFNLINKNCLEADSSRNIDVLTTGRKSCSRSWDCHTISTASVSTHVSLRRRLVVKCRIRCEVNYRSNKIVRGSDDLCVMCTQGRGVMFLWHGLHSKTPTEVQPASLSFPHPVPKRCLATAHVSQYRTSSHCIAPSYFTRHAALQHSNTVKKMIPWCFVA